MQTLLPAFFSEAVVKRGLAVERFVALIAANPARIFGLYPRKGTLAIGADADITLLDPDANWTVTVADALHKQKWTPYEGKEITGRVVRTMRRGETIFDDKRQGETALPPVPGRADSCPRLRRDDVILKRMPTDAGSIPGESSPTFRNWPSTVPTAKPA